MKNHSANEEKNLIGPTVCILRKNLGMTRPELSCQLHLEGVHISVSSLSALERQKRKVRDFELAAIAKVLGISANDLFPD